MNNRHQEIENKTVAGMYADRPPRHFPLLPGLLVLSAALHLGAIMVWPFTTEFPTVALKQLVLEIQRHDPPGIQATPPVEPQMKNTERSAARPPVKTTTPPPKTARAKQQLQDLASKPVAHLTVQQAVLDR